MKTNQLFLIIGLFGLLTNSFGADEEVCWKFKTEGRVYATPVIADTVLYIGSLDGDFYALNRRDGSEYWRYSVGKEIRTTAAIYDTIICFAGGNILYGLNIQGDSLWSFQMYDGDIVNSNDSWDDFNSSPILMDSIAYIGTEHGKVYGINVKTGTEVFSFQTSEDFTIETTPAVYDGKIYFGDWDGVFYCVDLELKTVVWAYDTKDDNTYSWVNAIVTTPVILNDSVYFAGRSCNLYCLDAQTGTKVWMHHSPVNMWLKGGPVIEDSVIYLGTSNQFLLQGFHKDREELLWSTDVDYRIFGTPFLTTDYVFFGTGLEGADRYGSLLIMDKYNHKLLARFQTAGQVHSSPIVVDSIVYFGCADSYIYAVNHNVMLSRKPANSYLKDGSIVQLGELEADDQVEADIYVFNDGEGQDSVSVSCAYGNVSIDPSGYFKLPAGDSQLVSISVDLSQMEPKQYSVDIKFVSNKSVMGLSFTKRYSFTLLGSSAIENVKAGGEIVLSGNAPNPFANSTIIPFHILKPGPTRLVVYNAQGKQIEILVDEKLNQGNYKVTFNGSGLPDGIYYYQLQSSTDIITRNMVKLSQ